MVYVLDVLLTIFFIAPLSILVCWGVAKVLRAEEDVNVYSPLYWLGCASVTVCMQCLLGLLVFVRQLG